MRDYRKIVEIGGELVVTCDANIDHIHCLKYRDGGSNCMNLDDQKGMIFCKDNSDIGFSDYSVCAVSEKEYRELVNEATLLIENEKDISKQDFYKSYLRGLKYAFDKILPISLHSYSWFSYYGYKAGKICIKKTDLETICFKVKEIIDSIG